MIKQEKKQMHRAGTSLRRLPIVKNRISSGQPKRKGDATETVAMTQNAGDTRHHVTNA